MTRYPILFIFFCLTCPGCHYQHPQGQQEPMREEPEEQMFSVVPATRNFELLLDSVVSVGQGKMFYRIVNHLPEELTFGSQFLLDRYNEHDGRWENALPSDASSTLLLYQVEPKGTFEDSIYIGEYTPGRYRITKVIEYNEGGKKRSNQAVAEFWIAP